jgi:hypothetical protein
MQSFHYRSRISMRNGGLGPALIAVGLIVLLAEPYSSRAPIVTAMALIALGATLATAWRYRCSPALPALIAAHLLVYSTLYVLLVGAVLHAAFAKSAGLDFLQVFDLGLSVGLMVAAIRIALLAIAGDGNVRAR